MCVCLCRKCARQALAVVAVATMSRITLTTLTHSGGITGGSSSGSNNNSNNDTRTGTLTHLMEEHHHHHHHHHQQTVSGRGTTSSSTGLISDGAERLRRQGSRLQTSRFACMRCFGNLLTHLVRLRSTPEELEQRYKSKEIDKFLEKEKHTFRRQVRLNLREAHVSTFRLIK